MSEDVKEVEAVVVDPLLEIDPVSLATMTAHTAVVKLQNEASLVGDLILLNGWMYETAPPEWRDDSELAMATISEALDKLGAYVVSRPEVSGEVLFNKAREFGFVNGAWTDCGPGFQRPYRLFAQICQTVARQVQSEQDQLQIGLDRATGPERESVQVSDTIFERAGSIFERDPDLVARQNVEGSGAVETVDVNGFELLENEAVPSLVFEPGDDDEAGELQAQTVTYAGEAATGPAITSDPEVGQVAETELAAPAVEEPPVELVTEAASEEPAVMSAGEAVVKAPVKRGGRPRKGGGRRSPTTRKAKS